jgi:hypothetical protein
MADLSPYQLTVGGYDYPTKYAALLAALTPYLSEVEAARGAQVSILANMNYLLSQKINVAGLAADFSANNFRIRSLPTPIYPDEPASKAYADAIKDYADGLAFAAALPAQTGKAGLEVTTNGSVAAWGISAGAAMGALSFLGWGN